MFDLDRKKCAQSWGEWNLNVGMVLLTNIVVGVFRSLCTYKLASVFHASVLLLIMNFVITLSSWLWIHEAIANERARISAIIVKY